MKGVNDVCEVTIAALWKRASGGMGIGGGTEAEEAMGESKKCKTSDPKNVVLDHYGVKRETDKAKLFLLGGREAWIAKSQIEYDDSDTLEIPRWLAEEKELI